MRLLIALIIGLVSASAADAKPLYGSPQYDPASKSYFEMVKVTLAMSPGSSNPNVNFERAQIEAAGRAFKGVRGRLAVVRSQETHEFLMQKFQPDVAVWIGLKYLCNTRELRWANGEAWTRGQFSAWANPWDQSAGAGCLKDAKADINWMPVAYNPIVEGFRWIAKGKAKGYPAFIVEYPVGHE